MEMEKQDFQMALDIQDASNLSGVVNTFRDILFKMIDREVAPISSHPIAILFADKVAHLTGLQGNDRWDKIMAAYKECHSKAEA